ncbi:MAG: type I-E CRISPR-associated endonuclease Cas1e [Acidimicrobiales bacterium]
MDADRPRNLQILPRFADGLSFLYVEDARIDRHDHAVAIWDGSGMIPVPCASLAVLLLGPGTTITHLAVRTLADHGCSVIWTGDSGVRLYASGTGETRHARYLERQATLWADPRSRLRVARKMYEMRFPGEDVTALSMEQLRGREGARVRRGYQEASKGTGIPWTGRSYERDKWSAADPVNRGLSAANACLYGLCHAGIVSLGCSPGLGFVHTGKQLSFVYDLADLYKTDVTIPIAFQAAAEGDEHIDRRVRLACRQTFHESQLLGRIVDDLHRLFASDSDGEAGDDGPEPPAPLWDPDAGQVQGGVNYGDHS